MFVSENTRVKVPCQWITTFRVFRTKTCVVRQILIVFMRVWSQRSLMKVGRGLRNFFQSDSDSKTKKRNLEIFVSWKQWFPAVMNNQSPNSGFIEILLLHSQHSPSVKVKGVKKLLNTDAAEASWCFNLIGERIDEAEIYDNLRNNKRSLDLSEYKKPRCLKVWKFAHSFRIYIKRTQYSMELTDPEERVQNMKLLMRWKKTIKQNVSAVRNNQCPKSGFLEI